MSDPTLTFADLEAAMVDLWNEVEDAGNTLIITKRTFLVLRRAMRMGERRKRVRSLRPRGGLVKLREIDLPEITYQEPVREPVPGLRALMEMSNE